LKDIAKNLVIGYVPLFSIVMVSPAYLLCCENKPFLRVKKWSHHLLIETKDRRYEKAPHDDYNTPYSMLFHYSR
jgi:hypothetical protein